MRLVINTKTGKEELLEDEINISSEELKKIENEKRITELKQLLSNTDYQAIKYAEGMLTIEEYEPIKLLRQSYRDEINKLEEEIKNNL